MEGFVSSHSVIIVTNALLYHQFAVLNTRKRADFEKFNRLFENVPVRR